MSDSTPILTPTRTAKDIVKCFNVEDNIDLEDRGISEHITTENGAETRQSYNEWRDTQNEEQKSSTSKKSNKNGKKKKTNIELLTGLSQSKILNSTKKPVLAQTKSMTTPLNGNKSKKFSKTNKKNDKFPLEKVFSEDPKCADYEHLAISVGSQREELSEIHHLGSKNSIVSNDDFIQQVEENKNEIKAKKQNLKDLEEEIVSISDKMTSYQTETDEIVEDLKERIEEREELNQNIKQEPMFYTTEGNKIDVNRENELQDEYTSEDDLLNLLKSGVDQKFKTFLDSCKLDLKSWKSVVGKEVDAFNQFLQHKQKILQKDMTDDIANFTPVLNGKFEVK